MIKNGFVIDGTGSPGFHADIRVRGDTIDAVCPKLRNDDSGVIDASGLVVTPGFIDMHHHGDLTLISLNCAEPCLMQGVTTLASSVCGLGPAPSNRQVAAYYQQFLGNLLGLDDLQLFDTFEEYFARIESVGISPNLALFVPHGNVRIYVMGLAQRPPTEIELNRMKALVAQGMQAGAFGLSTGLVYPPGSLTKTDELIALAKVVQRFGGLYVSHMRDEGMGVLEKGMRELFSIARHSGVKAHISHWKAGSRFAWRLTPKMIAAVQKARRQGLEIHADMYPYEEAATSLGAILLPPWVFEDYLNNLSNPASRQRIITEIKTLIADAVLPETAGRWVRQIPRPWIYRLAAAYLKRNVRILSASKNKAAEGLFLHQVLSHLYPKADFLDALLDFLRHEEGNVMASFRVMSEKKSILELMRQEFVCIGSDGFLTAARNTHPRSYGCFVRILGPYVQEKRIFSLEEAVRKMTSLPAGILGLKDRGVIKSGCRADLVIFNPYTVSDNATYENARQFPSGIHQVIVNGELTVDGGRHLGTLNGKILRHAPH